MRRTVLFLVPLLMGGALGDEASSQAAPPSLQDQINATARIRVLTARVQAELQRPRLAQDSLWWRTATATSLRDGRSVLPAQPLAFSDITAVELRGNYAGRGALIGGGIGAALGVAAAIALSSDEFFSPLSAADVAAVTIVPTLGGALLGGLIGVAVPRWRMVYRRGDAGGTR